MRKLFLAASFADSKDLFSAFVGDELKGKRVTFIPTASIPEEVTFYVDDDRVAFENLGMVIDELDISIASKEEIGLKIRQNNFIFLSGGNSFYLLQELKRSGAGMIISEQINQGKVYVGSSAGAVVLAEDITYIKPMDDSSKANALADYFGLGIVDFYPLPHYKNYPFEEIVEEIIAEYQGQFNLYPLSNNQAIQILGDKTELREA